MDSSAKRTRSATPVWHDGLIAGDLERSKSINDLKDIKPSWANNAEGLNGPAHKASGSSMVGQMSSHDEHVQDPIKSTNQTVVVGTNEPAASKTAMGSHSETPAKLRHEESSEADWQILYVKPVLKPDRPSKPPSALKSEPKIPISEKAAGKRPANQMTGNKSKRVKASVNQSAPKGAGYGLQSSSRSRPSLTSSTGPSHSPQTSTPSENLHPGFPLEPRPNLWTPAQFEEFTDTAYAHFPFAEFAAKHGKSIPEVQEVFHGTVRMPLTLRYMRAVEKQKARREGKKGSKDGAEEEEESLGMKNMKEYYRMVDYKPEDTTPAPRSQKPGPQEQGSKKPGAKTWHNQKIKAKRSVEQFSH